MMKKTKLERRIEAIKKSTLFKSIPPFPEGEDQPTMFPEKVAKMKAFMEKLKQLGIPIPGSTKQ